jgi:hypothetical protein
VKKLKCTPKLYEESAVKAGRLAGVNVRGLLAGSRFNVITKVRWAVWRELFDAGYSYYSIGKASGFDHTSVRYACMRETDPCMGRSRGSVKIPAPSRDEFFMRRQWKAAAELTRVSGSAF